MAIPALVASEKTLAFLPFLAAVTTIMWKTVGLGFIPGYEEIWGGPQYPRQHNETANVWDVFYLAMYGGLGMLAQWAGWRLSMDEKNRTNNETTRSRARLLGWFHIVIGVHHVAWSVFKEWGRLDLSRFNFSHLPEGLVALITMYHGFELVLTSTSTPFDKIIRHKTLVDASSTLSLIPLIGFLPANWMSYSNLAFERNVWLITMTTPLVMFAADFWSEKETVKSKTG